MQEHVSRDAAEEHSIQPVEAARAGYDQVGLMRLCRRDDLVRGIPAPHLGLSDSVLSKQLTLLENAGYVKIRKAFVGKRPRTWAKLSPSGRLAFEGHVLKLQEIALQGGASLSRVDGSKTAADHGGQPEPAAASSSGANARA